MAVTAYVFITTMSKETQRTLKKMRSLHQVRSADAVTGPYDIIATVEASDVDALGEFITQELQSLSGVDRTLTCVRLKL